MGLIVVAILNAFIAGCCAVPAAEQYMTGDLRGACFAAFLSIANGACALASR